MDGKRVLFGVALILVVDSLPQAYTVMIDYRDSYGDDKYVDCIIGICCQFKGDFGIGGGLDGVLYPDDDDLEEWVQHKCIGRDKLKQVFYKSYQDCVLDINNRGVFKHVKGELQAVSERTRIDWNCELDEAQVRVIKGTNSNTYTIGDCININGRVLEFECVNPNEIQEIIYNEGAMDCRNKAFIQHAKKYQITFYSIYIHAIIEFNCQHYLSLSPKRSLDTIEYDNENDPENMTLGRKCCKKRKSDSE